MLHTGLFITLMRKQFTSMSNLTSPHKLSRKSQGLLEKDYPAYLQKRKYLEIQKTAMSSIYGSAIQQKIKLHRRKQNKSKILEVQHTLVQPVQ